MKDSGKKTVIYTCITGNYDELKNHSYMHPAWDYICFTEDLSIKNIDNSGWQIKPLVFDKLDNARNNRWHKLHPHLLFPEYEKSVYVDANIDFLSDEMFSDFYRAVREARKISVGLHFCRDCLYDELDACIKAAKDDPKIMKQQIQLIKKDGFPERYGLFENGIIYREHHDQSVIKIMKDWWWWIENYSRRDQLSFTYVLWKNNFTVLPLNNIPYKKTNKISLWHSSRHATKEELSRRQKLFAFLFQRVKEKKSG